MGRTFTPAPYTCPMGFNHYSLELCHARSTIPGKIFWYCFDKCNGHWREHVPWKAWVVCGECGTLNVMNDFNTCAVCGWQKPEEGEGEGGEDE